MWARAGPGKAACRGQTCWACGGPWRGCLGVTPACVSDLSRGLACAFAVLMRVYLVSQGPTCCCCWGLALTSLVSGATRPLWPTQLSGQMEISFYKLSVSHPGKSKTRGLSPTLVVSRNSAESAQRSLGLDCGEVTRFHSPPPQPPLNISSFFGEKSPTYPEWQPPPACFPPAFQTSGSLPSLLPHSSAVVPAIGHGFRELAKATAVLMGRPWCCRTCKPHAQPLSVDIVNTVAFSLGGLAW